MKNKLVIFALVGLVLDLGFTAISYLTTGNWDWEYNGFIKDYGFLGFIPIVSISLLCILAMTKVKRVGFFRSILWYAMFWTCIPMRTIAVASHPIFWIWGDKGLAFTSVMYIFVLSCFVGYLLGKGIGRIRG